jgi:predicted ATPase
LFHLGELALARSHLEQSIILYDRPKSHSYTLDSMQDPGVTSLCYEAWALWFMGYAEQALNQIHTAFSLAQELSHPHELAWALNYAAALHYYRREQQATQEQAEAAIRLSTERGFPFWVAMGTLLRGWALTMRGRAEDGIAQMHQGLATWRAMGAVVGQAGFLAMLAEAQGEAGQVEEGLHTLAEAVTLVAKTGDRYYEVEMHRLKGELMLRQFRIQSAKFKVEHSPRPQVQSPKSLRSKSRILNPNSHIEGEAEACFLRAIEIARRQGAKSLELRAVMSLVRLRQQQATHAARSRQYVSRGRLVEAHKMLSEIYNWFTEGFDTPDLRDAKALLEELRA